MYGQAVHSNVNIGCIRAQSGGFLHKQPFLLSFLCKMQLRWDLGVSANSLVRALPRSSGGERACILFCKFGSWLIAFLTAPMGYGADVRSSDA